MNLKIPAQLFLSTGVAFLFCACLGSLEPGGRSSDEPQIVDITVRSTHLFNGIVGLLEQENVTLARSYLNQHPLLWQNQWDRLVGLLKGKDPLAKVYCEVGPWANTGFPGDAGLYYAKRCASLDPGPRPLSRALLGQSGELPPPYFALYLPYPHIVEITHAELTSTTGIFVEVSLEIVNISDSKGSVNDEDFVLVDEDGVEHPMSMTTTESVLGPVFRDKPLNLGGGLQVSMIFEIPSMGRHRELSIRYKSEPPVRLPITEISPLRWHKNQIDS